MRNVVENHNNDIPGDTNKHLDIKLNNKNKEVFIPAPNNLERFRKDGVKMYNWYNEINDYDFCKDASKNWGVVGHFT